MISGGLFDVEGKKEELKTLETKVNDSAIWDNPEKAKEITESLSNLKKTIETYNNLLNELNDLEEIITLELGEEMVKEVENKLLDINNHLEKIEIETLLNGKYDSFNCYLEIHPGAGGTEATDWAGMLLRMYKMFASKNNYTFEIIDLQDGEEAGIKSATVRISGNYAYGYFKSEAGVHRLVRISPFDSSKRRHTSFAAVSIIPEIDKEVNVIIKDEDLKIDVYRSSGKGGQSVNTTDSAVRITHLPTGIVVTCQNERSQIKNKATAMKILISKLEQLEIEKQEKHLNSLKGSSNIDFGSQIRNYTLEPYKLVKDVRTNYETSNTDKVLDGDIMPFMEAYLKR